MEQEIINLFQKYMDRQCDEHELEQVLLIIEEGKHQEEWDVALSNDSVNVIESEVEIDSINEMQASALNERILYTINSGSQIVRLPNRTRLWPRIAVAAAMVVAVGVGLLFFNKEKVTDPKVAFANDIDPAGNKAYLTLGNGKRIALTDASNGDIATESNVKVTKTADGQLVYTVAEDNSEGNGKLEYNTIETPNGGKYEITLPDNSHVWINAGSSLKFPVSFASLKERRVELQGEAYFEVSHNKAKPFRVSSSGQTVEVLGTHFNVNAYGNEPSVKTTLLEGSVKVSQANSQNFSVLKPGEQSILESKKLKISPADIEQAIAWKNGDFVFVGDDLKTVMRQVARWYDVDIEYVGDVNASGVVSTISRTKKLSQLLKALEANQGVHFKIEGRRVLVMP